MFAVSLVMEMVLFIGIQGSGKSTFYQQRFFHTHVRVNGDMLKTKHREKLLINACLEGKQPFVIDKVNATHESRSNYIYLAKTAGFKVIGYFFRIDVKAAIARNNQREGTARIPVPGIYSAAKRMEQPTRAEGFDELFSIEITEDNRYVIASMGE